DAKVARMLTRGLSEEGFGVELARDGQVGLERLQSEPYDVCILDVMLPRLDGFQVLAEARRGPGKTPGLVLTARDARRARLRGRGLDGGADDSLVKPFAFAELLARLRALLRRHGDKRPQPLRCRDLELDPVRHRATRGGALLALSAKQFALLEFLLRHRGEVV